MCQNGKGKIKLLLSQRKWKAWGKINNCFPLDARTGGKPWGAHQQLAPEQAPARLLFGSSYAPKEKERLFNESPPSEINRGKSLMLFCLSKLLSKMTAPRAFLVAHWLSFVFQCSKAGFDPGLGNRIPCLTAKIYPSKPQNKYYCNKLNRDCKNGPHQKQILLPKNKVETGLDSGRVKGHKVWWNLTKACNLVSGAW